MNTETHTHTGGTVGTEAQATFGWIPTGFPEVQQRAANAVYLKYAGAFNDVVVALPGGFKNPYISSIRLGLRTAMLCEIDRLTLPIGGNH